MDIGSSGSPGRTEAGHLRRLGAEVQTGSMGDHDGLGAGARRSDAVIHLAFEHDFSKSAEGCEIDRRAIEAIGAALAGSREPLLVPNGMAGLAAPGQVLTERDDVPPDYRLPRVSEQTALRLATEGANVSVVRLAQVHDIANQGLVTPLIGIARATGIAAYVGDGEQRWPAVHVADAARLFRLALEAGGTHARYHAVGEEGVPMRAIGPATQAKLRAAGCTTVAHVRDLDPRLVRRGLTVVGERIIHELRGLSCLDLATVTPTRKGCAVTRCFSTRVDDRATMEQAVAAHATRLGEKLRRGGLGTDHVGVFFHTSEHDTGNPQRSVSTVVTLPEATSNTLVLVKAATWAVRRLWRAGYRYSKAGLITTDLVRLEASQRALPGLGRFDREKAAALMTAVDACNCRFGRGTVVPAAAGVASRRAWATRFDMRSPAYLTRFSDLPIVRA